MAIVVGSVTGAVLLLILTTVVAFLLLPKILSSGVSDLRPKLSLEVNKKKIIINNRLTVSFFMTNHEGSAANLL